MTRNRPFEPPEVLIRRITTNPNFFGGKPIIRGRRLAVEHVLGQLAAGDSPDEILDSFPWLEAEDIRACLLFAARTVGGEIIDPPVAARAAE